MTPLGAETARPGTEERILNPRSNGIFVCAAATFRCMPAGDVD